MSVSKELNNVMQEVVPINQQFKRKAHLQVNDSAYTMYAQRVTGGLQNLYVL